VGIRARKLAGAGALAVFAGMLAGAAGPPAYGQADEICGNGGTGYCMNDWNGGLNNNPVKMYYGGSSNEDFYTVQLNPCNSSPPGEVTETCPFTVGSGYNASFDGDPIFAVEYAGTGYCIGTTGQQAGGPTGILTACPDYSGDGGGDGTMWIGTSDGNFAVTRYWINYFYDNYGVSCCSDIANVTSGGNPGQPLLMADQSGDTYWGGPGWNP
jgi:hypothetical protein